MPKVHVLECDYFPGLFVPTTVYFSETALSDKLLLLILVDDLAGVEGAALIVVVENVTISQVEHIIIVQENPLGGVYA